MSGDPIARLAEFADARIRVDREIASAVREARGSGHSWQEIGTALRISKQAAQQRFGTLLDDPGGSPRTPPR